MFEATGQGQELGQGGGIGRGEIERWHPCRHGVTVQCDSPSCRYRAPVGAPESQAPGQPLPRLSRCHGVTVSRLSVTRWEGSEIPPALPGPCSPLPTQLARTDGRR